ncbi:PepSY domain-containing protein [soil metagenome]
MRRFAPLLFCFALLGGTWPARGFAATAAARPMELAQRQESLGADWRQQQDEARAAVRDGRHMPLGDVTARINGQIPGRLLDAGIEDDNGRAVYRVRWAARDGRRLDIIADARTGAILRQEGQ